MVDVMVDREKVERRALAVVGEAQAQALVITTNEEYEAAGAFITGLKALEKEIDTIFDPIRVKAHSAWKETVAQQQNAKAPLVKARAIVNPRLADWRNEQERIRKIEEERLQREAEKRAEEERFARAEEAEKAGQKEEAGAILDEPDFVPPVILPKATPKLAGVSFKKNWKYQVLNEMLVPREFLTVDTVKLGQYARSFKAQAKVSGVRFYVEDGVVIKAT